MSTVQELLAHMRTRMETDPVEELVQPVIDAVRTQESLLVAFFTPTKHYFMTMEQGVPTAVIFSNRDSFELFAERCKEQELFTAAIENTLDDRRTLFLDLYRCGFRQIMIDYAPQFIVLPLEAFLPTPDESELPLMRRSMLNPVLNGKILYLLQQIRSKRASGVNELDTLRTLYHSVLLLPAEAFEVDGNTAYHVPGVMQGDKKLAFLYTDFQEWSRDGRGDFQPMPARYAELKKLFADGMDMIVINPGGGAELTLDEKLVTLAEKAAMGIAEGIGSTSLRQKRKVTVSDPEAHAEPLIAAMSKILQAQPDVRRAYLRVVKQDDVLRPSYLVILDGGSKKNVHMVLNKAAQPHLGYLDLEFADYEKAHDMIGEAKPFYRSKKRGFRKK